MIISRKQFKKLIEEIENNKEQIKNLDECLCGTNCRIEQLRYKVTILEMIIEENGLKRRNNE